MIYKNLKENALIKKSVFLFSVSQLRFVWQQSGSLTINKLNVFSDLRYFVKIIAQPIIKGNYLRSFVRQFLNKIVFFLRNIVTQGEI